MYIYMCAYKICKATYMHFDQAVSLDATVQGLSSPLQLSAIHRVPMVLVSVWPTTHAAVLLGTLGTHALNKVNCTLLSTISPPALSTSS